MNIGEYNQEEPYFGEVVKVEDFDEHINDEWIVSQIKRLFENK